MDKRLTMYHVLNKQSSIFVKDWHWMMFNSKKHRYLVNKGSGIAKNYDSCAHRHSDSIATGM